MTELLPGVDTPSDAELISRVRGGEVAAYGELFSRHVEAARRLARQLVRGPDVDDLVSDAFAKTLHVLQAGGGPDVAFRAYLLTSVRRLHVDRIRAAKKVQPSDDMTLYDDGLPFHDPAVASFENGAAARAFSSLPERWQLVLWHLEVEGQKPAEIAPLLGMSANSVSALAYRAREGLRQAFLTMHLADCATEQCRWVNQHLGAYVRKGLSRRDTAKVEQHLDECRPCTAMYLELTEVNSDLAAIIAPLLLGVAATGYLSSAGGAGLTGVSALVGRIRDALGAHGGGSGTSSTTGAGTTGGTAAGGTAAGATITAGGVVTAGGVIAAGVAVVTTAAFLFGAGADKQITDADRPVGVIQTPPAGGDRATDGADRQAREATARKNAGEGASSTPQHAASIVVAAANPAATGAEAPAGSGSDGSSTGAGQDSALTGAGKGGDSTARPEPGDQGAQTGGEDPAPATDGLPLPGLPIPGLPIPGLPGPGDGTPGGTGDGASTGKTGGGTDGSGSTGTGDTSTGNTGTGTGDTGTGTGDTGTGSTGTGTGTGTDPAPGGGLSRMLTVEAQDIVSGTDGSLLSFELTGFAQGDPLPSTITVTLVDPPDAIGFEPDKAVTSVTQPTATEEGTLHVAIPLEGLAGVTEHVTLRFTVTVPGFSVPDTAVEVSYSPTEPTPAEPPEPAPTPRAPTSISVSGTPTPHTATDEHGNRVLWDVPLSVQGLAEDTELRASDLQLWETPDQTPENASPVPEGPLSIEGVQKAGDLYVVTLHVPPGQGQRYLVLRVAGNDGPMTGVFTVGFERPGAQDDSPGKGADNGQPPAQADAGADHPVGDSAGRDSAGGANHSPAHDSPGGITGLGQGAGKSSAGPPAGASEARPGGLGLATGPQKTGPQKTGPQKTASRKTASQKASHESGRLRATAQRPDRFGATSAERARPVAQGDQRGHEPGALRRTPRSRL